MMGKWKRAAAATALLCLVQAATGNGLVTLSAASPAETTQPAPQAVAGAVLTSAPLTALIQEMNADPFGLKGVRDTSAIVAISGPQAKAGAAQATQPQVGGGGGGMPVAAKAAIWVGAVAVAGVWAYKTFSVTRGTD
jgi:hypothetical protein